MPILTFDPSMNYSANMGLDIDALGKIWFNGVDTDGFLKIVRYDPVGNTFTKYLNPFGDSGTDNYGPLVIAPNGDIFVGRSSNVDTYIKRFRPSDQTWQRWALPNGGHAFELDVDRVGRPYYIAYSLTSPARRQLGRLDPVAGTFLVIDDEADFSKTGLIYADSAFQILFRKMTSSTVGSVKRWDITAQALLSDAALGTYTDQQGKHGISGDILYAVTAPDTVRQLRLSTNTLLNSTTGLVMGNTHPMAISLIDGNVWNGLGSAGITVYRFDPVFGVVNSYGVVRSPYGIGIDIGGNAWVITGDIAQSPAFALMEIGASLFIPPQVPAQYAGKFDRGLG